MRPPRKSRVLSWSRSWAMKTEYVRPVAAKASTMARLPPPMEYTASIFGSVPSAARTRPRIVSSRPSLLSISTSDRVGVSAPHRVTESHFPLLLTAEEVAAQ